MFDAVNLLGAASKALLRAFSHQTVYFNNEKKKRWQWIFMNLQHLQSDFCKTKMQQTNEINATDETTQHVKANAAALQTPDKAAMSTPLLGLRSRFEAEGRAAAYRQLPLLSQADPLFIFSQSPSAPNLLQASAARYRPRSACME